MVGDQELDHLARVGRQRQALEDAAGEADAFRDVLLVARFPDIVQQQREHQQLRPFEVLQQRREPLALPRLGGRRRRGEPLEVADREERVLVDGVLVVEVAHDAARDRAELREHPAEQPAVVHLRQPRVQAGARLQELAATRPGGPDRERNRAR